MAVKILGGKLKGLSLPVTSAEHTRPTSVQLRRKLFDAFDDWRGIHFYDLCAGTGAVGLEALSRGALSVWLNDRSERAYRGLQKSKARIAEILPESLGAVKVSRANALVVLKKIQQSWGQGPPSVTPCFYFDPPNASKKLFDRFLDFPWGAFGGVLIFEAVCPVPQRPWKKLFHHRDRFLGILAP